MVDVAQSVRALDCGSRCRGFESHLPPAGGCLTKTAFFVGAICTQVGFGSASALPDIFIHRLEGGHTEKNVTFAEYR